MQGLIQKSGYIKSGGGAGGYAEYIATRDGVELLNRSGQYMEYIAERPRSHGLFTNAEYADLEKTMEEVNSHTAPVWTFIYSLRREDAARLGYDSAASWRRLLLAHQAELAEAMKIPPSQFRWYAAFHDEKHHPHIHMMVWSVDPTQGYLTEQGIETMRSKLANDIFQDELLHLYQQKDLSYQEVRDAAQEAMRDLIGKMESGICDCPAIEDKLVALVATLQNTKGKKVYGYLKKSAKTQVDAIVDELAQIPTVAECYEAWNKLRDDVEGYYTDKPREHLSLSQQKEFKAIKNMVIREAEQIRLNKISFEDEQMDDEQNDEDEVRTGKPGSFSAMTIQPGQNRRQLSKPWSSSGMLALPWQHISWESAGGMDWASCRTMTEQSCGFGAPPRLEMISRSMHWANFSKAKIELRSPSVGMNKPPPK